MTGRVPNGSSSSVASQAWYGRFQREQRRTYTGLIAWAVNAWAVNALTAGKCPFILAPVMGITRQAGKMSSGAWGQAAGGRRPEGAFCTTLSLHGKGCKRKCRPKSNQSSAPTLSFHL